MAKATSVHSTPPANTSANNPSGPVDPTRRRLLTVAAGGDGAAAIPTAAVAGIPASGDTIEHAARELDRARKAVRS